MKVFIAGTDTGVGKTYVTTAVSSLLLRQGLHVGVMKWVGTGGKTINPDITYVIEKTGMARLVPGSRLSVSCPYNFSFPASPHLSATLEGRKIDPDYLMEKTKEVENECDVVIVEGVGGLMVPLTEEILIVDLVEASRCPVILVSRSGLGTINHTLLSIDLIRRKGIELYGVVMNRAGYEGKKDETDEKIVRDNCLIISKLTKAAVYGPIPYGAEPVSEMAASVVDPLSKRILRRIK